MISALNLWMEANKGSHSIHATDIKLSNPDDVYAAILALPDDTENIEADQGALWTLMRKRGIWAKIERIARLGDSYLEGLGLTNAQAMDLVDNALTMISAQRDQGTRWEVHDPSFQAGLDALIALTFMTAQDKADIIALGVRSTPASIGLFGEEPRLSHVRQALMLEPHARRVDTVVTYTTHWDWADGSTTSAPDDVTDHTLGS